jgi:hypothetical protein
VLKDSAGWYKNLIARHISESSQDAETATDKNHTVECV